MFKRFLRNKKAQNTAEYAILIALVVAGIIAMQTWAQRALQGRVRAAGQYMVATTGGASGFSDTTLQYEPYYLSQNYEIERFGEETKSLGNQEVAQTASTNRTRGSGGFQQTTAPSGYVSAE